MKKTIFLLCLVAVLTSSCSTSKNSLAGMMNILNAKWALQSLAGQSSLGDLFGNKLPFLQFDTQAKRVSGNNGCNSITGPLTITEGNKISFPQMASTKMACPERGESVFMDALNKVTNFKVDNSILTLLNGTQELMKFTKDNS